MKPEIEIGEILFVPDGKCHVTDEEVKSINEALARKDRAEIARYVALLRERSYS